MFKISPVQRKTLGEMYNKSNEFDTSRRTWCLPIALSSDGPDASSKRTKKQSPMLQLANGARLRQNSYLNIRHIFKVDWSLLKVYTNPETPDVKQFRFDRKSTMQLLAKSTILTGYEPGEQHQTQSPQALECTDFESDVAYTIPLLQRSISEPMWVSKENVQMNRTRRFSDSDIYFTTSCRCSETHSSRSSLRSSGNGYKRKSSPVSKVQRDTVAGRESHNPITWSVRHPLDCLLKRVAAGFKGTTMTKNRLKRREKSQLWVNVKGVMAVVIASI
jgi:hypothetical protein